MSFRLRVPDEFPRVLQPVLQPGALQFPRLRDPWLLYNIVSTLVAILAVENCKDFIIILINPFLLKYIHFALIHFADYDNQVAFNHLHSNYTVGDCFFNLSCCSRASCSLWLGLQLVSPPAVNLSFDRFANCLLAIANTQPDAAKLQLARRRQFTLGQVLHSGLGPLGLHW